MRGYVHPEFEAVRQALSLCVRDGVPGGAAVSVVHRGETVVELATGTADRFGRPFENEELRTSWSRGRSR